MYICCYSITFHSIRHQATEDQQQQHLDDDAKVKLRDKRNAAMREPSKRHSWSPRTKTTATANTNVVTPSIEPLPVIPTKRIDPVPKILPDRGVTEEVDQRPLQMALNGSTGAGRFTAKSSVLAKVLVETKTATRNVIEGGGGVPGQVQYQPPPMRPQLPEAPPPLQKNAKQRGFVCDKPPLIDDSKEEVDEELSDAGTYTLDGDNYTEEQKEMMDIDNKLKERQLLNKWDELIAAQQEQEEQRMVQREAEEGTFLKCKRPQMQRPTSFEPSLEVSGILIGRNVKN